MEIEFSGRRALVTGAGQGIGRAIAIRLSQCNAHVVAISRTLVHLESLRSQCPNIEIHSVDVADWNRTREVMQNIGPIDLLVNNAAVTSVTPFLEVQPEAFDRLFSVNVKAVINISQMVIDRMIKNGKRGSIVNVSSQASMTGLENHSLYCASKSALDSLTRVMAKEFGPHKVMAPVKQQSDLFLQTGNIKGTQGALRSC